MSIKVTVAATIKAPVKKVWEYYTEPTHITQWNFAADDWQCPWAENDLRPGGKYRARMEAKDGSFGFDFEAVYDEVVKEKRIRYTMADGRVSTTEFEAADGETKLVTTFDAEETNPVEMQRQGWQAILDNFKKHTEAG